MTPSALVSELREAADNFITVELIDLANRAADALTTQQAEIDRLKGERDEARKLIYVPGLWRCAKCELRLVSNIMCASTGDMTANNSPQQCANGCGPMWRVTEREAGNKMADDLDAMRAERDLLRTERDRLVVMAHATIDERDAARAELVEVRRKALEEAAALALRNASYETTFMGHRFGDGANCALISLSAEIRALAQEASNG